VGSAMDSTCCWSHCSTSCFCFWLTKSKTLTCLLFFFVSSTTATTNHCAKHCCHQASKERHGCCRCHCQGQHPETSTWEQQPAILIQKQQPATSAHDWQPVTQGRGGLVAQLLFWCVHCCTKQRKKAKKVCESMPNDESLKPKLRRQKKIQKKLLVGDTEKMPKNGFFNREKKTDASSSIKPLSKAKIAKATQKRQNMTCLMSESKQNNE